MHPCVLCWQMCAEHGYVTAIRAVEAALAPFCSSCLQSRWHGAWSSAGLHTKAEPALPPLLPAVTRTRCLSWYLNTTKLGSVFTVLQLCQCATGSRCDWLKLMEGAGLSLIAQTHTHTHTKLTSLLPCCCLGLISKPVITWQDWVLMLS